MEKAIFISNTKNLELITREYTRLYFGIEFCERLIPSTEELSYILNFTIANNMDFTFVTPFVTDNGLKKLEPLIEYLVNFEKQVEIVINDWGFLSLLKKRKWNGPLVLGRLLTKQKRGPRIMNVLHKLPKAAVEHFRQSNIDVPILSDFLIENGIYRVELDNLLQGISRPNSLLKGSLYFPYAYVTVTRYCLIASSVSKTTIFRSISPCNKECQNHEFELSHASMPVKLLLKGNTQFFRNDNLPNDLESLNIDRLVFEPKLPI